MKKVISILLIMMVMFTCTVFAGCGKDKTKSEATPVPVEVTEAPPTDMEDEGDALAPTDEIVEEPTEVPEEVVPEE